MDDVERAFTLGDHARPFESLAALVVNYFPGTTWGRFRDVIELHVPSNRGDEDPLVLFLNPEYVEVRVPSTDWTGGSYGPLASSRPWKRVKITRVAGSEAILRLLRSAFAARDGERVTCRFCARQFLRDHAIGDTCHGCATRELGVAF